MFEHTEDSVEQLTHDGDQSDHFAFSESLQVLVKGLKMGVMVGGGEGRHIEGATDMAVADLTDTHFFMDRGSGVMLSGVQAGISNPLSYVTVGGNQR